MADQPQLPPVKGGVVAYLAVDGAVKAERIAHETSAFTFCALKDS